jgi:hypothetical protein
MGGSGGGGYSGGGYSGGGIPTAQTPYQPMGQPYMDQLYNNIVNTYGAGGIQQQATLPPYLNQYLSGVGNTPGAGLATQGAQQAYDMTAAQTLPQAQGGANMMYGLGMGAVPYAAQGMGYAGQGMNLAGQVAQTGFDPQNALYNRTQQQVSDQLAAVNAMQGLSGTPYGAGVQGQGLSNFNIDWQNAQLARQQQASQAYQQALQGYGNAEAGYGNIVNAAGKGVSAAYDLNTGAAGQIGTMSGLPYQTALGQQTNLGTQIGNYNQLLQGSYGMDAQTMAALMPYLQYGQNASTGALNAVQANQNANQQLFNQQQTLGSNMGAGIQQFGNTLNTSGVQSALSGLFGGSGSPSTYAPGSANYQTYSNPNLYYDPSTVNQPGQVATPY